MTRMTLQNYTDYVLKQLGHPNIEIENADQVPQIVQDSLGELMEYYTDSKFVTIPYTTRMDLTNYKVRSIIQVYRTMAADSITGMAGSTDAFLLAVGMIQGVPYDLTRFANLMQVRQIKNTIMSDLDWVWNDPYLLVSQNVMQDSLITIEYTPAVTNVEEITDDYWIGKLKKLALANEKIILGRIRTKYKLTNALYVNDGDQILSEGLQEKQALQNFLEQNSDTLLPVSS